MCLKKGAYVCINKREKFCHYHKLSIGWFLWGLVILTFTKMGAYFFWFELRLFQLHEEILHVYFQNIPIINY